MRVSQIEQFSTARTEKGLLNKLGKTRLVIWRFDVTNKIKEISIEHSICMYTSRELDLMHQ